MSVRLGGFAKAAICNWYLGVSEGFGREVLGPVILCSEEWIVNPVNTLFL